MDEQEQRAFIKVRAKKDTKLFSQPMMWELITESISQNRKIRVKEAREASDINIDIFKEIFKERFGEEYYGIGQTMCRAEDKKEEEVEIGEGITCYMCDEKCECNYGNNPYPLTQMNYFPNDSKVCNKCNMRFVIPVRIALSRNCQDVC